MKTNVSVSTAVLRAIVHGTTDIDALISKAKMPAAKVKGTVAALKRSEFVTTNVAGELKATAKGRTEIDGPAEPRAGTKMAKAYKLIQQMQGKPRQMILTKLQDKVGLTEAGASTYLFTLGKRIDQPKTLH